MLSTEDNHLATRIGPGTAMGALMREYWLPAMLSEELATPDSPPVRVLLLGEKLIGFRDSSGRPALVDHLCPHRGAGMYFGRNEEDGLRCVYHGWKFDLSGACVDMPSEPAESSFKNKVRIKAYPCVERGGIIWAYMGPRSEPPALPDIEGTMLPEGEYRTTMYMRPCNWLQALEGDIDTAHAAFLHNGAQGPEDFPEGTFNHYEVKQRAPHFVVADTDYGAIYGASRPAKPGENYWRIGEFMFPVWTQPPPGLLGHKILSTAWVPMDDTHTMVFGVMAVDRPAFQNRPTAGPGAEDFYEEGNPGWYGRYRMAQNEDNDYWINREDQADMASYTGIPGNAVPEDTAVQVAMGSTLDRTIEHLGTTDVMIIRVRNRLIEAAVALTEHKVTPPGVDSPEVYRVRSGGVFLPEGADWLEGIKDLVPAFVDHPELDPAIVGPFRQRPVKAGAPRANRPAPA
jgi:phthalate 4,5-dioxygenase